MPLSPVETLASIFVMAIVTFFTRALPFLLFDRGDRPPKIVLYLGKVLPPAIINADRLLPEGGYLYHSGRMASHPAGRSNRSAASCVEGK